MRRHVGPLSLINRQSKAHRAHRRVIGQLFSAPALRRYTSAIVDLVEELSQELLETKGPVQLRGLMRRVTFGVISTTVLGVETHDQGELFDDFEFGAVDCSHYPNGLPAGGRSPRLPTPLGSSMSDHKSLQRRNQELAACKIRRLERELHMTKKALTFTEASSSAPEGLTAALLIVTDDGFGHVQGPLAAAASVSTYP